MNIEQSKTIPIIDLLDKLNIHPTKQSSHTWWFISPIRSPETNASFKVDIKKNTWVDFGTKKGGDPLNFAREWLKFTNENDTVRDGLRWLEIMGDKLPRIQPVTEDADETIKGLQLVSANPIEEKQLIKYLGTRKIPMEIASKYLREVRFKTENGKLLYALGMKNEDEGYEFRNPFMKGCIGKKNITVIRGTDPKPEGFHVFEGQMDFLSYLAYRKATELKEDVFITHTVNLIDRVTPYLYQYGYKDGWSYMHNDEFGRKATTSLDDYIKTQQDLVHHPMNELYKDHKDLNAWLVASYKPG